MEFIWPVRVYYEDTDAGGVVYYANYLKFMERARTEWLRQLGFEQDELRDKEGILFIVRRLSVDYLRPARFNDELLVSATIKQQGRASLTFQQEIRSADGSQLLCRGEVQVAALDVARFRPTSLPATLMTVLNDDV